MENVAPAITSSKPGTFKVGHKPGRVNGHNSLYKSGGGRLPKPLLYELRTIIKEHRDKAAHKEKKVGAATQEKRSADIENFFRDLYSMGYKLQSVHSLKQKHLTAVFNYLEEQGQAPSTIQGKISTMRMFCEWIGKFGMVKDSTDYVTDPRSVGRSTVAQEDKSWVGHGVDVLEIIDQAREIDVIVGLYMELIMAFGLRIQESVKISPYASHEEGSNYIRIREGTKGDRPRVIPIEETVQMDIITRAKQFVDEKTGYIGHRGWTVKKKMRRLLYVAERCGITLAASGVTLHGLRHQYIHQSFKRLTGIEAPVRGGNLQEVTEEEFRRVSHLLVERVGHSRPQVLSAYSGSSERRRGPRKIYLGPVTPPENRGVIKEVDE